MMEAEILGTALIAIVILTFWISCLKRSIAEAEEHYQRQYEAEVNRTCPWTSSGNYLFNAGCGGAFHSDEKWKRCQECGGKVEVVDAAREEG